MKSVIIGAHLLRDDVEPVAAALPAGDLFLSALEVADEQPIGDRELLLRVAETRAKLLDVATFVAIRYGFTASGAAEAASKVSAHLGRWKKLLTEHREHVEMTLKVAASSPHPRPDRREFTSGAKYLRALHAVTQAARIEPAFREIVESAIVPLAVEHRWSARDEKSVELAMLVARENLDAVRAAGEKLRETRVPFLLSGPWPLEVFAE
jgi:Gas vesicle synthesis protein GvpL/GvpF